MSTVNRSHEGVFSHECLRKDNRDVAVVTGFYRSPGIAAAHLSCHTSRCPSVDRSANWAIIASLTSSCGCSTPGCSGSACPFHTTLRASRLFTTRPSTKSLPNGLMMARSGRRLWPVCGISRSSNSSISACSMATEPTRWLKKGRWDCLFGVQASDRGEGHRHDRQPWLCAGSAPCSTRQ